jgi:hypothetical protein
LSASLLIVLGLVETKLVIVTMAGAVMIVQRMLNGVTATVGELEVMP